ncbi:MAG: SCP-2 sterol transfer family protein [Chromatiales bacterium]|nr:SCP-2 sterol transfer family protein [Chromatiales bacterium]
MSDMFSDGWMKELQEKWNASSDITGPLAEAKFSARIAYGYKGDEKALGMLVIENGRVVQAGAYDGSELDWDLRADADKWNSWIEGGFGLTKLGPAVATGALQFATGNYRQMIRNPSLANPFLSHFKLMQEIGLS